MQRVCLEWCIETCLDVNGLVDLGGLAEGVNPLAKIRELPQAANLFQRRLVWTLVTRGLRSPLS